MSRDIHGNAFFIENSLLNRKNENKPFYLHEMQFMTRNNVHQLLYQKLCKLYRSLENWTSPFVKPDLDKNIHEKLFLWSEYLPLSDIFLQNTQGLWYNINAEV